MNEVGSKQFNHLKIHTQFSICEGALRTNDLAKYCKEKKISLVWFRIFFVFGKHQRIGSLIPYILSCIKNNKKPNFKNLENRNDYVYIKDVIDAFVKAIKIEQYYGIINLGSGKSTSIKKIVSIISKKNNNKKLITNNKKTINKKNNYIYANIQLANKILNWQPKYNLNRAIDDLLNR